MAAYIFSVLSAFLLLSQLCSLAAGADLGLSLAWNMATIPPPKDIVGLMKNMSIRRIHLYQPLDGLLAELNNTGIEVILTVQDGDIMNMGTDRAFSGVWITKNVMPFVAFVNFRCIAVGNGVISRGTPIAQMEVYYAMRNLQKALLAVNLTIPVSTVLSPDVMSTYFPPSNGSFVEGHWDIVQFLNTNRYPLMVELNPYYLYSTKPLYRNLPLDFALLRSSVVQINDTNGHRYSNLIDAWVDAVLSAVRNEAGQAVKVIVTGVGWPFCCGETATVEYARDFYDFLLARLHGYYTTPLGSPYELESYMYTLFTQDPPFQTKGWYGFYYPNMTETGVL